MPVFGQIRCLEQTDIERLNPDRLKIWRSNYYRGFKLFIQFSLRSAVKSV